MFLLFFFRGLLGTQASSVPATWHAPTLTRCSGQSRSGPRSFGTRRRLRGASASCPSRSSQPPGPRPGPRGGDLELESRFRAEFRFLDCRKGLNVAAEPSRLDLLYTY